MHGCKANPNAAIPRIASADPPAINVRSHFETVGTEVVAVIEYTNVLTLGVTDTIVEAAVRVRT